MWCSINNDSAHFLEEIKDPHWPSMEDLEYPNDYNWNTKHVRQEK